ncbi:unnamed protein product [Protopolystoma xenopodis]|uniref:Uncharacterized protein n=1 Tax=Protopolystoma xenopodis TaxID=117903 RepID=A0A448WC21_9PLAT|nr:unnamed protein product [Protopolystoma xenopodis]
MSKAQDIQSKHEMSKWTELHYKSEVGLNLATFVAFVYTDLSSARIDHGRRAVLRGPIRTNLQSQLQENLPTASGGTNLSTCLFKQNERMSFSFDHVYPIMDVSSACFQPKRGGMSRQLQQPEYRIKAKLYSTAEFSRRLLKDAHAFYTPTTGGDNILIYNIPPPARIRTVDIL